MFDPKLKEALGRVQKPGRYTGGEPGSVYKDKEKVDVRFAFCFPDTYEVGMSFLGEKILYELLNSHENWWCERAFMPWLDMKAEMERLDLPLYTMESKDPLTDFDAVGFTLQYELSCTNILAMLDLAHIPFYAKDRDERWPLIVAGGPCACNSEPIADFFDVIQLGEGENQLPSICAEIERAKKEGGVSKKELLRRIAKIPGVYIPAFYDVTYFEDGRVKAITPNEPGIPAVITKAIIKDLNEFAPPTNFVVPMVGAIQDRASIEVLRGCVRGCRFCHAGMVYRPVRERHPEVLKALARKLVDNTGYNEISLVSLSTADYTCLAPMIHDMIAEFKDERVSVSLPSLRIDSFSVDLAKEVQAVRKSGLTFAPEAGSQRMRDVINKGVTEEDLMNAVSAAFKSGWSSVKLYFMIGLPGETDEDVLAIADLAKKVQYKYREITGKGGCKVTVSASSFVPKPYTPFQWSAQNSMDELRRKQYLLKDALKVKNITFQYHDPETSIMEAVFARGDRRLGKALYLAWQRGAKFDGWSEQFDYERWLQALQDCGLDKEFYIARERGENEVFPWEHIQPAVSRAFLRNEYKKAQRGELTHDCRRGSCTGCGVCQKLGVQVKVEG